MNVKNMETQVTKQKAKKFGLYAIGTMALQGLIFGFLFFFKINPKIIFYAAGFFMWFMPFFVTYVVEKQTAFSLGLILRRNKFLVYSLYTIVGLLFLLLVSRISSYIRIQFIGEAPGDVMGVSRGIFSALFIQLSLVGFPEELYLVFYDPYAVVLTYALGRS